MANKVIHKRSTVKGQLPTGSTLEHGEIAVNFNSQDPFLSIKDSDGTYRKIIDETAINDKLSKKSDSTHTHSQYLTTTGVAADSSKLGGTDAISYALKTDIPGVFTGATSSVDGKAGLVKAPIKGQENSFLKGDGTWGVPTNTVFTAGAYNSTDKLYLIGAPAQTDSPVAGVITNSNSAVYMEAGKLYANGSEVGTMETINNTVSALTASNVNLDARISAIENGGVDVFTGATSTTDGNVGLVPAPTKGDRTYFLKGDGTWGVPINTVFTAGAYNSTDKLYLIGASGQTANKMDGILTNSNSAVYMQEGTLCADKVYVSSLDSFIYADGGDLGTMFDITLNSLAEITVNAGSGLTGGGTISASVEDAIRTGTVSIGHSTAAKTSFGSSSYYIKTIGTDAYGHITGITSGTPTNTRNTAGSSNSTSKLYLVGGTSQSSTGVTTYSNSSVYMQEGVLYADKIHVSQITMTSEANGFQISDGNNLGYRLEMAAGQTCSTNSTAKLYLIGASKQAWEYGTNSNSSVYMQDGVLTTAGLSVMGDINVTGTVSGATAYYQSSDERLKDFGEDINIDFDKLKEIPKKYFTWKSDDTKKVDLGTSAQKVRELYPELVGGDDDTTLSVDYAKLSIVALKAVDKLHEENEMLRAELDMIKKHLGL